MAVGFIVKLLVAVAGIPVLYLGSVVMRVSGQSARAGD
jgi:hypothetical protein